jgi:uncharacterized protein YciW
VEGRAELRAWYLASLRPKLAHAARRGAIEPAAAADLERQLEAMLDLAADDRRAA